MVTEFSVAPKGPKSGYSSSRFVLLVGIDNLSSGTGCDGSVLRTYHCTRIQSQRKEKEIERGNYDTEHLCARPQGIICFIILVLQSSLRIPFWYLGNMILLNSYCSKGGDLVYISNAPSE
jgi:hypothetical protein